MLLDTFLFEIHKELYIDQLRKISFTFMKDYWRIAGEKKETQPNIFLQKIFDQKNFSFLVGKQNLINIFLFDS